MGDTSNPSAPRVLEALPPPIRVADYAQTCVSYVEKSIGILLDFTAETLPVLDHYLRQARQPTSERPETITLLASVSGSYLGEVLRTRNPLQWNVDHEDPLFWSLSSPDSAITIFPVAIARIALEPEMEKTVEVFSLNPALKNALRQRLELLPDVSQEEYVAPSTRTEVVDIAFDLLAGNDSSNSSEAHRDCDHDDHLPS